MLNLINKLFCKHESQNVSCPYTGLTYTLCNKCGKHMKPTEGDLNG